MNISTQTDGISTVNPCNCSLLHFAVRVGDFLLWAYEGVPPQKPINKFSDLKILIQAKKRKIYQHRWKEGIKISIIAKFHGKILQSTNIMAMKVFQFIYCFNGESN